MYHMHSVFSTGCEKPAHRHTLYSLLACSAPGDTRPRAFSFAPSTDADADLAMLSCITLSFFLYFSVLTHAARITQVHLSRHVTVRSRSVDVRAIASPHRLLTTAVMYHMYPSWVSGVTVKVVTDARDVGDVFSFSIDDLTQVHPSCDPTVRSRSVDV